MKAKNIDSELANEIIKLIKPFISSEEEIDYLEGHLYRYVDTLRLIPMARRLQILDCGSGPGHLTILLKELYKMPVTAVDVHSTYSSRFERLGIDFKVCNLEMEKLAFKDESFDLVVFCEVVEHLHNPSNSLSEIHRVLRSRGLLIFTTPNVQLTLWPLRLTTYFILRKTVYPKGWRGPEVIRTKHYGGSHVKEYTVKEIARMLGKHSFKVEEKYLSKCWDKVSEWFPSNFPSWKLCVWKLRYAMRKFFQLPVYGDIMIVARKI